MRSETPTKLQRKMSSTRINFRYSSTGRVVIQVTVTMPSNLPLVASGLFTFGAYLSQNVWKSLLSQGRFYLNLETETLAYFIAIPIPFPA